MKRKPTKAEHQLKESEERFRTMADNSNILIAVADETSDAIYFNKAWVELTGRKMEDLLRFGWADLVHPDDRETYVNTYLSGFAKQESFTGEFRILNKDGGYTWLLARNPPRIRSDGSFAGYISSCVDITSRKLTEEAMKKQEKLLEMLVRTRTKELEQSNEDLQQFVHVIGHDLREPVRKIKTFTSRLEYDLGATVPDKAKYYMARIQSSANRIVEMIEGVMKYSMLHGDEMLIKPVDLNLLFRQILSDIELVTEETKATIRVAELPVIDGVPVMLYQLFYNLLNNSLKFARSNVSPVISVKARILRRKGKEMAEFQIKDNGIGFGSEYAERIFTAFVRLNSIEKYEGTGLGLALCKKISERHHGTIQAKSPGRSGATFVVILPLKYDSPQKSETNEA
jgi:PAS domain S-box-containing protein